jgi:hypothetical protein
MQGNFPFLGGRSYNMKEVFFEGAGIKWFFKRPKHSSGDWDPLLDILKRGMPVVLRVDMRYLPYLYGGHYGPPYMSFGWHMVTLFGVDSNKNMAFISDTAQDGLQEIKLEDLEKARFSDTKVFPPLGEYYWIEKKPSSYELNWKKLTQNAIAQVVKNMKDTPPLTQECISAKSGLDGLKHLGNEIVNIETTIQNRFMIPIVFNFWYGCIETNGTGGAAFRILFRNFLKVAGEKAKGLDTRKAIKAVDASIAAWHELALGFKEAAKKIGSIQNREERKTLYQNLAKLADCLYQEEEKFISELQNLL